MDKILVTGAAGFIGYHFSKKLMDLGYKVVGIDNMNSNSQEILSLKQNRLNNLEEYSKDNFKIYFEDVKNKIAIRSVFSHERPPIVIHLAGKAGVRDCTSKETECIESNVNGFLNVISLSRDYNVRNFIYASSSSVYGGCKKLPFFETSDTSNQISLYGATKYMNELIAKTYYHNYNFHSTGLRFFSICGSYSRPDMAMFLFTKSIMEGIPIDVYNNGDMSRSFTHIEDITNCLDKIVEIRFKAQVFNFCSEEPIELMTLVKAIERETGKRANIIYKPMFKEDMQHTRGSTYKAREDFGFIPKTKFDNMVIMFIRWYKKQYGGSI